MIMQCFSVWDKKAEFYSPPFYTRNEVEAIRAIALVLENPDHPFAKNTTDYILFKLAEWDDSTGLFSLSPEKVAELVKLKGL